MSLRVVVIQWGVVSVSGMNEMSRLEVFLLLNKKGS